MSLDCVASTKNDSVDIYSELYESVDDGVCGPVTELKKVSLSPPEKTCCDDTTNVYYDMKRKASASNSLPVYNNSGNYYTRDITFKV
jgi:hypothetical protein